MAAAPVYDDEKEKVQGHHDDLGVHPERREAEVDDLNRMYTAPSAKKSLDPDEISDQEDGPGGDRETSAQKKEGSALSRATGGFYRHEGGLKEGLKDKLGEKGMTNKQSAALFGAKDMLKQKFANQSKGKKAAILFGAGFGGGGLLLAAAALLLLVATLKIPNLGEHIFSWQSARAARTFRLSMSQANAEKIAVDSADDSRFSALKQKYEGVRSQTWGKLDKWRPTRTYKNMQALGRINYKYSEPNLLGRQRLEKIIIDGSELDPSDQSAFRRVAHPFQAREDRIRLSAQIDANIEKAMHGQKTFVRSSVAKKIRADLGIKLSWWEQKGQKYKNLKAEEANRLAAREAEEKINRDAGEKSKAKPLADAEEAARKAQDACLADDDCVDREFLSNNADDTAKTVASTADDAIASSMDSTTLRVLETTSTVFAIAQPICIIYEGSVENSAGTVDAANASLQSTYYSVASAADQQKAGDTTAEAVGAMNRKLGNTATSIPSQRAKKGQAVNTDTAQSPQAAAAGHFSLLDALFGANPITERADDVASTVCPYLTDWKTGLALTAAEVAIAVIPGIGQGIKGGTLTAKAAVSQIMNKIVTNLLSKRALRRILGTAAAVAGLTVLAKLVVLSRMNAQYNGLARDEAYANQADMGGKLHWDDIDRQMNYGRPLTEPEVVASTVANRQYIAQQKAQKGTFERYLALSNPDSLLVNMGLSLSSQLTSRKTVSNLVANTGARFSSSLLNSGLFGALNPFKKQLAYAQESQAVPDSNYQLVSWGWSEDELALIENDPEYFPLRNDEVLELSGKKAEIESKYGKCFTETVGTLLGDKQVQRDEDGRTHQTGGDCSPQNLGRNNPTYGDLVFRWRLSKKNVNTIDHLIGIAEPTQGTQGASAGAPGGLGISPDGFVFPLKTTKSQITGQKPYPWCSTATKNCHHDYNAADIFAPTGTQVVAAKSGKLIFGKNKPTGGAGSNVAIMGDDGNVYFYTHMRSGSVKFTEAGVQINAGDVLGEVGTDADAQGTPAHLHFDVQPPPATTRPGCSSAECTAYTFLDVQPVLVPAFNALPE